MDISAMEAADPELESILPAPAPEPEPEPEPAPAPALEPEAEVSRQDFDDARLRMSTTIAAPSPGQTPVQDDVDVGLLKLTPGAEASPGTPMDEWLEELELEMYADALRGAGYSTLRFLRAADLQEIAADVPMKRPHARAFAEAWAELSDTPKVLSTETPTERDGRRELETLPKSELMRMAHDEGLDDELIEGAVDSGRPLEEALVDLIIKHRNAGSVERVVKLEFKPSVWASEFTSNLPQLFIARSFLTRVLLMTGSSSSELLELKPSELQKRAWASGASEVAVATAWDSADHKNALIELIIKHGSANPAFSPGVDGDSEGSLPRTPSTGLSTGRSNGMGRGNVAFGMIRGNESPFRTTDFESKGAASEAFGSLLDSDGAFLI